MYSCYAAASASAIRLHAVFSRVFIFVWPLPPKYVGRRKNEDVLRIHKYFFFLLHPTHPIQSICACYMGCCVCNMNFCELEDVSRLGANCWNMYVDYRQTSNTLNPWKFSSLPCLSIATGHAQSKKRKQEQMTLVVVIKRVGANQPSQGNGSESYFSFFLFS